jgi:hypothetical protein
VGDFLSNSENIATEDVRKAFATARKIILLAEN